MIIARAPVRISLGGGGTDLPYFSSKFGGSLISIAINKYVYTTIGKREFYTQTLLKYSKNEEVEKIDEIKHTRIREALRLLSISDPLEITTMADVPIGTGLGSSSSFLVSLLKGLHEYKGEYISSKQLAEEACNIEIGILKEPIGKQDQYMAAFGGLLHLNITKENNVTTSPININHKTLKELEGNLLLFYTGIKRDASEVLLDQKKTAESDNSKIEQMHEIKKIGIGIKKALETNNLRRFGTWLNTHWELKRRLAKKMTCNNIDRWYDIAIKNGAIGGKLLGAGGGGFLMFYCDNHQKRLRAVMQKEGLQEMPFKFDFEGAKIIFNGR